MVIRNGGTYIHDREIALLWLHGLAGNCVQIPSPTSSATHPQSANGLLRKATRSARQSRHGRFHAQTSDRTEDAQIPSSNSVPNSSRTPPRSTDSTLPDGAPDAHQLVADILATTGSPTQVKWTLRPPEINVERLYRQPLMFTDQRPVLSAG